MSTIIEYYTIKTDHPETLDTQVNERIARGWEPQGGVSYAVIRVDLHDSERPEFWHTYVQAMVKRTEKA